MQSIAIEQQMQKWFDEFHANPEVSWHEFETTKRIASILEQLQVDYKLFNDVTGVIAEIGEGQEVIAVRADIDALWQEVNGVMQGNHSCGHDANITMVLGAIVLLKEKKLSKKIRIIFQPAEEQGGGALGMIERNVMESVTHLFGIHLRPADELTLGKVAPAIHHGSAVFLNGSIKGADAHGARPHQGNNAIDVLWSIQHLVKSIYIDPFETYSVKLTKIVADGGSVNVIPGNATFSIDVRAQKNDVRLQIQQQLEQGFERIGYMHNTTIQYEWLDETPGAEVSEEATAIAKQSIIEELGAEQLADPVFTPGSDDFHFYTIKNPNLKAVMLGIGADLKPGLHHPHMTFDRRALLIGARALEKTLYNAAK